MKTATAAVAAITETRSKDTTNIVDIQAKKQDFSASHLPVAPLSFDDAQRCRWDRSQMQFIVEGLFLSGGSYTQVQLCDITGYANYSSIICRLRQMGWPIQDEWFKVGEARPRKEYTLDPDFIREYLEDHNNMPSNGREEGTR